MKTKKEILNLFEKIIYDVENDNYTDTGIERKRIELMLSIVERIHHMKSETYGQSWKKRGWSVSIFSNISRKFDRLEKIFSNSLSIIKYVEGVNIDNNSEEFIFDTFLDLGVYCLLACTEIMDKHPELFKNWLEKNINIDEA